MRLLFFIFLLFCNIVGYGFGLQGFFYGKITDAKTGNAIADATIYITDIKVGTSTDKEGNFSLKNIPEGKHLIEISHIGYTSVIETIIIISTETKINFTLTEAVVENNAVVVTGVTGATQLKKVPFAVSVIKKQDLFQTPSTNIIDALTKNPGVSALATGPAISKPVIRGLGYNRVLTINDGVRQEGQQWGDEHGIEIDEASVNKIELLKGPASIIYGSDAMAGVINIITNVPVSVNTIKANINTAYQSNNRLRSLNTNIGGNKNGVNWSIYSSNRVAADYKNKYDGFVYNSKFKENNAGGFIGYNGNWGYSHLLISNFNLKTGLIEGERDANGQFTKPVTGGGNTIATNADFKSTAPQIPYQHIQHFKISTDNSIKINNGRIKFNLGFQRNQRQEFGNIDKPEEQQLHFDLKTITYTSQYYFEERKGWKSSVGINGMQQSNSNRGEEQLIPDYNLFDIGGYLYSQKTTETVTYSGGIRFDSRHLTAQDLMDGSNIKNNGFKKSFANISGSIGLAWQATDKLNIKLNTARGYRAPSLPELASNGAHEGSNRYEYGYNNLKNETSLQFDGGFDFNAEHVSVNISSYYNSFNNFIFYSKLKATNGKDSLINVNGDLLTAFKFSQRKAALAGAEVRLDIHPHPIDWLHIENSFSFVSGKFAKAIEGSKNIPLIPAPKLSSEIRGNFNHLNKAIHDFYILLQIDNTFTQNNILSAFNTETKTPSYTLLNFGIGANFVNKKKQPVLNVSAGIQNATNVSYQNHLSRLKYTAENLVTGRTGIYNMGRNFTIKINMPLSFTIAK